MKNVYEGCTVIQWKHITKKYTNEQLLKIQNEHLKKYYLPPKKRIDPEIILRLLDDTPRTKQNIAQDEEVMFQ